MAYDSSNCKDDESGFTDLAKDPAAKNCQLDSDCKVLNICPFGLNSVVNKNYYASTLQPKFEMWVQNCGGSCKYSEAEMTKSSPVCVNQLCQLPN